MTQPKHRAVARRRRTASRVACGALVFVGLMGVALAAMAVWSSSGSGVAVASVGTLEPPTAVTVTSFGPRATVTWAEPTPPEGALDGYIVTRFAGGTPSSACGTSTVTRLAAGTTTCTDTAVPDGTYRYTVTAVFRSWTAESAQSNSVTVVGAESRPSQTLSLGPGASNAYLGGTTLYYRSVAPGSFQFVSTVTGSPIAPSSATFPNISTTGWTHPAETVTAGTGSAPTIAYTSSGYGWTTSPSTPGAYTVTAANTEGDTVDSVVSFAADNAGPTGGALTVNGTAASAGTTTSATNTAFSITRTDYDSDAGAGVASSLLTRESATLSNGICGTFGGTTTLTGAPEQTGLTPGCYLYTLTGTDNVGNTSSIFTVVRYDTTSPTQGVTLTSGVGASQTGNVIYYRNAQSGSFVLSTAVADSGSGPASVEYPATGASGWTHAAETITSGTGTTPTVSYSSSTYSFSSAATPPGAHSVVGRDTAGNSATTTLSFTNDVTAPTGGALTVNATGATSGGSSSFNNTGGFTIARTDFDADADSGLASSVLTVASAPLSGNTCGSYGTPTTIAGAPAQSGLATACWRYVLTGTDNVGNVASLTTTVKVDRVAPTGGALTVNNVAATGAGSMSSINTAFAITRTDWTDAESGITATAQLVRTEAPLSGGACGTFGTPTTIDGTPTQSGLATNCYRYTLTGTDNAGNSTAISTTVRYDTAAPTGGALTVNGTTASGAGTTSTATSSFSVDSRTDYTDAASGLASSTLTRQYATMSGTTCGGFGSATVIAGGAQTGLAAGCYLYRLTGTDNAGNSVSIFTTVKLNLHVTALSLTNASGGIAGRMGLGDQIVATFSEKIAVGSMCTNWSNDDANQVLNGDNQVTVTLNNSAGSDFVTVSSNTCTLNFGNLGLGSTAYATANATFGGTGSNKSIVAWNATTRQLTVTVGAVISGTPRTVSSSVATYTPATAVTSVAGVPAGGSFSTANVAQF